MLDGARKLLLDEYYGNREIVAVSPHYAAYADEKYRHSLQVLGAGNFIIRHEHFVDNINLSVAESKLN